MYFVLLAPHPGPPPVGRREEKRNGGSVLAAAGTLHAFQLGQGGVKLPPEAGFIKPEPVHHFPGWHQGRRFLGFLRCAFALGQDCYPFANLRQLTVQEGQYLFFLPDAQRIAVQFFGVLLKVFQQHLQSAGEFIGFAVELDEGDGLRV